MARRSVGAELPFIGSLSRSQGQLGRQLAQALRNAVKRGDLKPGELLPSSRVLANSLNVARGVVTEAYEQLVAEGVLESRAKAGTRVSRALGNESTREVTRPMSEATQPKALPRSVAHYEKVADEFSPLPHVPFTISVPVNQTVPEDIWRRIGNRVRARGPGAPAGYDHQQGAEVLREEIADYVRRSRSVHCSANQIVVTSGIQQALYLCCKILLDVGDSVWVEDPAYRGLTAILEHSVPGTNMVPIPVDDEGMDVNVGIEIAKSAKAAFVTPSHQYPLGMPLSMSRRNALLAWAREANAWIVEDDYDSELRYAGHPFPSLQGLDPSRVIYLGTFSKILFPSLRLGYAIVPKGLEKAFCGARALMDRHPPSADQHVLAAFMKEGHLDRHIRKIRGVYAERRLQLTSLIKSAIPSSLAWLQPSDQGMHLILWITTGIDDKMLAKAALEQGVAARAVSTMYASKSNRSGLVLGLGDFSDEQIAYGVNVLAKLILGAHSKK
ncbi:PLP-dependent aminotransferase family protein [Pantoea sp. Ap-967]|uniref:MocR-like pyridoxine biosynthesis transcription factor PdxR n=1 Tax=Pantoea sp. Ap-967 TaxID=2608362 RepID=UPI0014212064|nr:PLP-dependent aminotransferase family protein [Pantoea sp. Ap-967]NIE77163.1 PLP-dependent aminotransferase family protein [Pantoea sp. Ap-967]